MQLVFFILETATDKKGLGLLFQHVSEINLWASIAKHTLLYIHAQGVELYYIILLVSEQQCHAYSIAFWNRQSFDRMAFDHPGEP